MVNIIHVPILEFKKLSPAYSIYFCAVYLCATYLIMFKVLGTSQEMIGSNPISDINARSVMEQVLHRSSTLLSLRVKKK